MNVYQAYALIVCTLIAGIVILTVAGQPIAVIGLFLVMFSLKMETPKQESNTDKDDAQVPPTL